MRPVAITSSTCPAWNSFVTPPAEIEFSRIPELLGEVERLVQLNNGLP